MKKPLTLALVLLVSACTTAKGASYFRCDPNPVPLPTATVTTQPLPAPTVTVTAPPLPQPTVTVTAQPLPAPTVTVTAQPLPAPTVTITVTPVPLPSPSVSSSPSPLPSPSMSPLPPSGSAIVLRALADEPAEIRLHVAMTEVLPVVAGVKIEAFEIMPVTTLIGSAREFLPGVYEDPTFPVGTLTAGKKYLVEITPSVPGTTVMVRLQGQDFEVRALNGRLPRSPSLPFYAELESAKTHTVFGLPDNVSYQGPMTVKFATLLRDHRIEPIKQDILGQPAVANGVLNVDQWASSGASFRQLVLDGRIACPMVLRYVPGQMPALTTLQAIEASIQAGTIPACSWSYVGDEGQGNPSIVTEFTNRANLLKTNAPTLKRYITWRKGPETPAGLFSMLIPVVNLFTNATDYTGQPYGNYISCMSNGNCANVASQSSVNGRTPYPVAVLDGPPNGVELRAFMNALESQKAKLGLYFNTTQRLATAWDAGGQYNEGGNGDGTLIYPGKIGMKGLTDNIPVGSLRLKAIRRGSIDVEYRRLAVAAGVSYPNPATSYTTYSRQDADYDAMREAIRRALFPAAY